MKRTVIITAIMAAILFAGCQPTADAQRNAMNNSTADKADKFIPPADGKISEKQADTYIKVAQDLNNAILEQVEIMQEFYDKHSISGKEEIERLKDDRAAMDEWDDIIKIWEAKEAAVYKKHNITSEEFDWIASALIDEQNAEIQKKIEKALTDQ